MQNLSVIISSLSEVVSHAWLSHGQIEFELLRYPAHFLVPHFSSLLHIRLGTFATYKKQKISMDNKQTSRQSEKRSRHQVGVLYKKER